jgi:hypothetical protein
LVVYGGIFGEGNKVLDDFALFDITQRSWMKMKLDKHCKTVIGPLAYHTMTTIVEPDTI